MRVLGVMVMAASLAGCQFSADGHRKSQAEDAVRQTMTDPAAAQFRGVKVLQDGTVCGEVNGKNAFGGYVGFRQFVYAGETATVDSGDARGGFLVRVWARNGCNRPSGMTLDESIEAQRQEFALQNAR